MNEKKTVIKFSCKKCGNCCASASDYSVNLYLEDVESLSRNFKIGKYEFIKNYCKLYYDSHNFSDCTMVIPVIELNKRKDGRCIFLNDNNLCSVYEYRPQLCVISPFDSSYMYNINEYSRFKSLCLGMDGDEVYMLKDIQKMLVLEERLDFKFEKDLAEDEFLDELFSENGIASREIKYEKSYTEHLSIEDKNFIDLFK